MNYILDTTNCIIMQKKNWLETQANSLPGFWNFRKCQAIETYRNINLGVSYNGGIPRWTVYNGKSY